VAAAAAAAAAVVVVVVVVVVTAVATEYSKDARRWVEEQKLRLYVNSWCLLNYLAAPLVKPLLWGGGGVGLSTAVLDASWIL
jgi:hypothetical protein